MPCVFALLAVAFPRVAVILLWLFTGFFNGIYQTVIIPLLGFIFLPLTFIVYTYLQRINPGGITTQGLVFIFVAVVLDLGLLGGGSVNRRRRR
ncbi:MAG: hypothetical protein ACJ74Y_01860 [Bryobacteraceae bacterium]